MEDLSFEGDSVLSVKKWLQTIGARPEVQDLFEGNCHGDFDLSDNSNLGLIVVQDANGDLNQPPLTRV